MVKSPYANPVLAIDPGGTTGIAVLLPNGELLTTTFRTIKGSAPPRKTVEFVPTEFFKFLQATKWQLIIVEGFFADNMINNFGLYTIQLIGAIKMFGHLTRTQTYVQPPQYRYSARKQMTTLLAGRSVVIHERDATMHLLAFLEKGPSLTAKG